MFIELVFYNYIGSLLLCNRIWKQSSIGNIIVPYTVFRGHYNIQYYFNPHLTN